MAGKERRSREARVMGLLKEMEENIVKEETQAFKLLHNIEDNLRSIVSNVDLRMVGNNKGDNVENRTTGGKVWTEASIDPKRPWTEIVRTKKIVSIRENKDIRKKSPVRVDKVIEDNPKDTNAQEGSTTSLDTTSSKVQQLKLFWDKFFLTETEHAKSSDLLDKSNFVSEAKYAVLEKPKRKSMRKSAARLLEKTIPPCRVPISFRMVPSKQNRPRKKAKEKEETFSEVDSALNREVSTCISKIPESSDELDEEDSDYTLAEESNDESPACLKKPVVSEIFKERLYNDYLTRLSVLPQKPCFDDAEENKNIYCHAETKRQISCLHRRGIVLKLKGDKPLHCYTEGVVVRRDEAIIIDPSVLVKTKKPERKPRKMSTLLPCYYFTVHDNQPLDIPARGDSSYVLDPKKKANSQDDIDFKDSSRLRTTVSYEKLTISSASNLDKTQIKLIIAKEEPMTRLNILVIFTFSSVTLLGFVIVAFKFFQGSFLL